MLGIEIEVEGSVLKYVTEARYQKITQQFSLYAPPFSHFQIVYSTYMSIFHSFPIEYQMDSQDCGPACLKMIATVSYTHLTLPTTERV